MINQQNPSNVFQFERKYSTERVINVYVLIFTTTLIFGSINSWWSNDLFSAKFLLLVTLISSISLVFNKLKKYNLAKSFIFIVIGITLFFYDSYDGAQSAAYLFYFPLSLAIVNIYEFDNPRERAYIFFHFAFNAILIFINIYTNHTLFTSDFITPETVHKYFIFNFVFSILCISYFIYLIVQMNISQKRLIGSLTDEMLRSKTFEETKKTSNDILFAELQHRLKNNLSLMSSLIRLKMEDVIYENVQEKITEASHAIQIVADANRFVTFKNNSFCVPAKPYFNEVVESWMSLNGNKKVNFTLDLADYDINIKQAVPIALILHEVITLFCRLEESRNDEHYLKINLTQLGLISYYSSIDNLLEICKTSEDLVQILIEQIDAELVAVSLNEFEVRYVSELDQTILESESIFA